MLIVGAAKSTEQIIKMCAIIALIDVCVCVCVCRLVGTFLNVCECALVCAFFLCVCVGGGLWGGK